MVDEMLASELAVSAITIFELEYGAWRSARPDQELAKVRAFLAGGPHTVELGAADAAASGEIRARLAALGQTIGAYDLLIAGQARARDWTLVTANRREFARVPGLSLEDWSRAPA